MKTENIEVNINANAEELENAIDDVKEAVDMIGIPNITIRNRGAVEEEWDDYKEGYR